MSTKYCDHGLYGAAVVTANTTNANATLTVTAVTSGTLGLGAMISGTNIPANSYISALGTGKGGAGTYTMSTNATGTATGTTITATCGGPALEPGWGVAQEGDGTASSASTSAIVSIDLSAATAAAGDTISIMGATLTCVASGASTNQFNAGSGATLVSNLVTAINRTTNTSAITAQATGWTTPKIQDAVFARINGTNTTLDIMTRAGSAQYNSSTVAQSGIDGVTGPWTFSGGAGGAWGHVYNPLTTYWPSAVALGAYGLLGSLPNAGVQNAGDITYWRNGKTLYSKNSSNTTISPSTGLSTDTSGVYNVVDDGTIWSGDSATGVFKFSITLSIAGGYVINLQNPAALHLIGKRIGTDSYNLVFEYTHTAGSLTLALLRNNRIANFNLLATSSGGDVTLASVGANQSNGNRARFENAHVSKALLTKYYSANPSYSCGVDLINVTFDNTGSATPNTGVITAASGSGETVFIGTKFTNFVTGSALLSGAITNNAHKYMFQDTEWGGVTSRGPYSLGQTSPSVFNTMVSDFNSTGNRDFSLDINKGLVQWNSSVSQPTLAATLPDDVTPWSWKIEPGTTSSRITETSPLQTPRIAKVNSLADGARTFTLRFCLSDQITTWTKKDVSMLVMYTDVNGDFVVLDTWDYAAGALASDASSVWSQESGGQVTYSSGGTLYHNKFKLEISTPSGQDLPEDVEVGVYFRVHNTVANSTQFLFVDPDVSIA